MTHLFILSFVFSFIFIFIVMASFSLQPVHAGLFHNAYVSFELPDRWNCRVEETEWVCASQFADPREAIIVLTAKEVGPQDSLAAYEAHLKTPRTITTRKGAPLKSSVISVKSRRINDFDWMDGFHENSEVPHYYTRYLATTKDKIAVLVTFSAHKRYYTKYSGDFFRSIQSLRVIATANTLPQGSGALGEGSAHLLSRNYVSPHQVLLEDLPNEESAADILSGRLLMAILIIIAALGFYIYLKKRNKSRS